METDTPASCGGASRHAVNEQCLAQRQISVLAALAFDYADDHALAVDVGSFKCTTSQPFGNAPVYAPFSFMVGTREGAVKHEKDTPANRTCRNQPAHECAFASSTSLSSDPLAIIFRVVATAAREKSYEGGESRCALTYSLLLTESTPLSSTSFPHTPTSPSGPNSPLPTMSPNSTPIHLQHPPIPCKCRETR
jgi:hypothetical protein